MYMTCLRSYGHIIAHKRAYKQTHIYAHTHAHTQIHKLECTRLPSHTHKHYLSISLSVFLSFFLTYAHTHINTQQKTFFSYPTLQKGIAGKMDSWLLATGVYGGFWLIFARAWLQLKANQKWDSRNSGGEVEVRLARISLSRARLSLTNNGTHICIYGTYKWFLPYIHTRIIALYIYRESNKLIIVCVRLCRLVYMFVCAFEGEKEHVKLHEREKSL